MPRVPEFERGVKDAQTPLGGGNVPAPNLTNQAEQEARRQVGQTVKEISGLAIKIQEKELQQANNLAVDMAEQAYMDKEEKLLHGDGSGRGGYLGRLGANAVQGLNETMDERKKIVEEIEKTLTPKQLKIFQAREIKNRRSFSRVTQRHFASELRKTQIGVLNAKIENAVNRATASAFEPETFKENLETVTTATYDRAKILQPGKGPTQLAVQKNRSHLISRVALAQLGTREADPEETQKFIKKYDKDLTHDDRVRITEAVEEQVFNKRADDKFTELNTKHRGDLAAVALEITAELKAEGLKEADKDVLLRTRRLNDQELKARQDNKKKVDARNWYSALVQIDNWRAANNDKIAIPSKVVDNETYQALSRKRKNDLLDYGRGVEKTTESVLTKFENLDDDKIRKMSDDQLRANFYQYFTAPVQDEAKDRVKDIRKGINKNLSNENLDTHLKRRLIAVGINSINDTQADKKRRRKFKTNIGPHITRYTEKENMTLDQAWNKAIDDLLQEVYIKETAFGVDWLNKDSRARIGAVSPADRDGVYLEKEEIPPEVWQKIRQNFARLNKSPTDDQVQRAAAAMAIGDNSLLARILSENAQPIEER